ncbi:MAG: hypothetical protein JRJ38_07490 [Deltaproteobacteria bacterium]|nr:hypothetical protein [Deltaproteobacteria bacterium]
MIINKEFGYASNLLVKFKRYRIKKLAIQSGCEITLRTHRDYYDRFQLMGGRSEANNSKQNINRKKGHPMAKKLKRNKIDFKDKVVNIGIDMHKRSWGITGLVEGNIVMAVTLASPKYDSFKNSLPSLKVIPCTLCTKLALADLTYMTGLLLMALTVL